MNTALDTKDLLVRTLPTPNPYALKFVINASFKDEGKATFNTPEEASDLPLVRDLFAIVGVKQLHLFQNTLSVTHSGELTNEQMAEQVEAVIRSYDPCLSCSTHALGQMPLLVQLVSPDGEVLDQLQWHG